MGKGEDICVTAVVPAYLPDTKTPKYRKLETKKKNTTVVQLRVQVSDCVWLTNKVFLYLI